MDTEDFKVVNKKNQIDKLQSIKKMWELMAQRPSDFDMQVIDALKATITNNYNNDKFYGCYGEKVYLTIREQLINFKTNDGKKYNLLINDIPMSNNIEQNNISSDRKKKELQKKEVPIKKADIIRLEATMKKLNERLSIMLNSLNFSVFIIPAENIMFSNILEFRALGFIYMSWFIANNKEKYTDRMIPFSIIVSLQRFISIITNYEGYNAMNPSECIQISKTLIDDLKNIETILIKKYAFDGVALYEQASDLILGSQFDIYLPQKSREAFEHQKNVSRAIMDIENLKHGFIMFYRTMTNSGKTSTIINIATAVQELRKKYPSVFGDLQVIATCDVQPVLTRWGQLLYHAGIPFGVGSKRYFSSNPEITQKIKMKAFKETQIDKDCIDINMKFSNSDTCKSISERIAIICPTDIAIKILMNAPNVNQRFILLHDEPTMHADNIESLQLKINMQVIQYAPKWSIFSSATLPFDEKSEVFIKHHKSKFPNAKFIDNYSTEIYSCCNMKTYDAKIITPHLGCTNKDELTNAIEHISKNPFLGKLYTPTSVKTLYDESIEVGAKNNEFMKQVPNITEYFSKVENLYPDNVRQIALKILKSITILNDKQIAYICSMDYESESEDDEDQNPLLFKGIDFQKLGTTEAYKFPYLNLIANDTPMEFMISNYDGLVTDIKKKIGSLDKLEYEYEKALNDWQNTFDTLEQKIKNADELSRQQSDMYDIKPIISFPDECQINTKQHMMKYAKHAYQKLTSYPNNNYNKFRVPNSLNNINLDNLHITQDCKLQLLSGVGFYANPNSYAIDTSYLETTLDLTGQKKMECLIADTSICYGTDYPIGGVIITKEFSDTHSLNTIYQLMSRAGRGRKSNNSEIYVDISCAMLILDTVKQGFNSVSNEVNNMITIFNSLLE